MPQAKKSQHRIQDHIEFFSFLAVCVCVVVTSGLDLFGFLDALPFVVKKIPTISLLVLGILGAYLAQERRSKLDKIQDSLSEILNQPLQGIEIFLTTDEILDRMVEVTVDAETICTLNLSPARGTSPALDNYFENLHRYIKSKRTHLKSFRTLASLDSISKACWVLERSAELAPTSRVSTSVFPYDIRTKVHIGFHIVFKKYETPYVFFYPPVNPSGIMDGFLIKNEEIANIVLKYFDMMWNTSIPLHQGKKIYLEGLKEISKLDQVLIPQNHYYKQLQEWFETNDGIAVIQRSRKKKIQQ